MAVQRALISVFDKTGIVEFARRLAALKIEILSTGGTAKLLREAGIPVRDVSDFTGWPEMLGGRVKTLHPKVHGGLLFRRGHAEDQKQAAEHGIAPIDLVVVNLYPFEATAAKAGLTAEELIENVDIGGPTMLRSAAKNFESVTVVTDPADFERVASEIEIAGETALATRLELARKVFATTSRYDGMIAMELERLSAGPGSIALATKPALPERVHIALRRQQELRYGENPHQAAGLYVPAGRAPEGLAAAKQLQGKELSYNNLVDLEAARSLAAEFKNPAAVIIKHNNPCGTAEQATLLEAYLKALACDPVSAFGGVLAFNREVDPATAEEVAKLFAECVAAPGFDRRAKEIFAAKKNLRLLELPPGGLEPERELQLKRILGGMLVQQPDLGEIKDGDLRAVTKRVPTAEEMQPRRFRENRGDEGAIFAGRLRGRLRRLLSLSRWSRRSSESRGHRRNPAGRLRPRLRRDRHCRPPWPSHGPHRHASLSALRDRGGRRIGVACPPAGRLQVAAVKSSSSLRNCASFVRGTGSAIVLSPKFLSCPACAAREEFPRRPTASLRLRRGMQRLLRRRWRQALLRASTTLASEPAEIPR
jgi:phosphoribosylaminoimidazolecarboxamide formyltransferase/IMP cyclohydrolase